MVPTNPGIKDGKIYYHKYNVNYTIYSNLCVWLSLCLTILVFICHFGRILYLTKVNKIENEMIESENSLNTSVNDIFPPKKDKQKLGIQYYYIWSFHVCTFLSIIFSMISTIIVLLYYVFNILIINCTFTFCLSITCNFIVKWLAYCIGIIRIFSTFHGSHFEYNNKYKILFVSWLAFVLIFTVCHFVFFMKGYPIFDNDTVWCQLSSNLIIHLTNMALDITLNILLMSLFIKPAALLSKNSESISEGYLYLYICFIFIYLIC